MARARHAERLYYPAGSFNHQYPESELRGDSIGRGIHLNCFVVVKQMMPSVCRWAWVLRNASGHKIATSVKNYSSRHHCMRGIHAAARDLFDYGYVIRDENDVKD